MRSSTIQAVFISCLTAPSALSILVSAAPTGDGSGPCSDSDGQGPPSDALINVDVAVVGGGFSGMAAAYQLHQAGLKVVVLEATDVLGGRSRSHQLESGPGLVELGATWINNKTQPAVTALAKEFDLELIEQYTDGYGIRQMLDGSVTFEGGQEDGEEEEEEAIEDLVGNPCTHLYPAVNMSQDPEIVAGLATAEDFIRAITIAERQIDLEVFDEFPVDEDVSFEKWILLNESWDNPFVHANARQLTTAIVGREPEDVGAHYWFDYLRAGGGLSSLLGDDANGAQQLMVKTG